MTDTPAGLLVTYQLGFKKAFNGLKAIWAYGADWSYRGSGWVKDLAYFTVAVP